MLNRFTNLSKNYVRFLPLQLSLILHGFIFIFFLAVVQGKDLDLSPKNDFVEISIVSEESIIDHLIDRFVLHPMTVLASSNLDLSAGEVEQAETVNENKESKINKKHERPVAAPTEISYEQQLSKRVMEYKTVTSLQGYQVKYHKAAAFVKLNKIGQLIDYSIYSSTGDQLLDSQILEMIRRAAPFPAPPAEYFKEEAVGFLIPFSFGS
jgi:TonB family protein